MIRRIYPCRPNSVRNRPVTPRSFRGYGRGKAAAVAVLLGLLCAVPAWTRDHAVRAAFLKAHGLTRTPAGCQIDHVVSLHLGGEDTVENLCLLCGNRLAVKEWAERREVTLRFWLRDNERRLRAQGCRSQWRAPAVTSGTGTSSGERKNK